MDWEDSLDAHAETNLPNGECTPQTSAVPSDDDTFKGLDALASTLDHANVHADVIAGFELGDVVA